MVLKILVNMDFKVAGTKDGITALQMEIKIQGITPQFWKEAFNIRLKERARILDELFLQISEPT